MSRRSGNARDDVGAAARAVRHRLTGSVCVVLLANALTASPHAAATAVGHCLQRVQVGAWVSVRLPSYPAHPYAPAYTIVTQPWTYSSTVAYAVTPQHPEHIFVTNGRTLLETQDGGCTWRTAFTLDNIVTGPAAVTAVDADYMMTNIAVSRDVNGRQYVYLAVQIGCCSVSAGYTGIQAPFFIAVSADSGRTWRLTAPALAPASGTSGASAAGVAAVNKQVVSLAVSPSSPTSAYVDIARLNGRSDPAAASDIDNSVIVTSDAGNSWSLAAGDGYGDAAPFKQQLAVDPTRAGAVYVAGCSNSTSTPDLAVEGSQNAASWSTLLHKTAHGSVAYTSPGNWVGGGPFYAVPLSLARGSHQQTALLAGCEWGASVWSAGDTFRSTDGGHSWQLVPAPEPTAGKSAAALVSATFGTDANHALRLVLGCPKPLPSPPAARLASCRYRLYAYAAKSGTWKPAAQSAVQLVYLGKTQLSGTDCFEQGTGPGEKCTSTVPGLYFESIDIGSPSTDAAGHAYWLADILTGEPNMALLEYVGRY